MAVYLFVDESGDLQFTTKGSRYFMLGVLSTREPVALSQSLMTLRYELLLRGTALKRFHASEDRQDVRDQVFDLIQGLDGFEFDVVVAEKAKVSPSLQDPADFYPRFANFMLKNVLARYDSSDDPIVIVTDEIPVAARRKPIEKAFKGYISAHLAGRKYTLVHQSSHVHPCLQLVDYLTWAIHKKWSHGEMRPYEMMNNHIRSEVEITGLGQTELDGEKK